MSSPRLLNEDLSLQHHGTRTRRSAASTPFLGTHTAKADRGGGETGRRARRFTT
jgi:hypothetical protein